MPDKLHQTNSNELLDLILGVSLGMMGISLEIVKESKHYNDKMLAAATNKKSVAVELPNETTAQLKYTNANMPFKNYLEKIKQEVLEEKVADSATQSTNNSPD